MKELIISISILVFIFTGNAITENYTKSSVSETTESLQDLREEIIKEETEINSDFTKEIITDIHNQWDEKYESLAYYIEHDELEKVETQLTALQSYIEKEEYTDSLSELDKSIYILNHIKEKTAIKLKNIF